MGGNCIHGRHIHGNGTGGDTDGVAGIETRSWKTDIDRLPAYAASCPAYTTRMHVSGA